MPSYDEVEVGQALPAQSFPLTRGDLVRYAGASGDFNIIHWNERVAKAVGLPNVIAHGMLTMATAGRVVTDWVGDPARVRHHHGADLLAQRRIGHPDRGHRDLRGAGWILVIVGLAALVLPGPGLLALFAGMTILATQYEWADRLLAPVKKAALKSSANSVKSRPRLLVSVLVVCLLIGLGVYWGISAAAPAWWPVSDKWWLVGGWGAGSTLIGSGVIAFAMLVYSYLNFRDRDEEEAPAE